MPIFPWRLIGLAAGALVVLSLFLALTIERRQNDKLKAQVGFCQDQLKRLADESDAKRKSTARIVERTRERIITVEKQVRRIEAAPLPGQCKTPELVMGADL